VPALANLTGENEDELREEVIKLLKNKYEVDVREQMPDGAAE